MSINYLEMGQWLLQGLPKKSHKVYISIASLNHSLRSVFADEMKYATTYIPIQHDGMILVNLCAFSKAFTYILSSIDEKYMKIVNCAVDKKNFTIYISADGGMLPRLEMAGVCVAMKAAGFQLEYYDDRVSLSTPLRVRNILALYERDPELLRNFLTYDFLSFERYKK